MNPRYAAYAKAHGKTPARMLAHDKKAWRGGCMAGFIIWIQAQWRAWASEAGRKNLEGLTDVEHAAFDAWLAGGQMALPVAA